MVAPLIHLMIPGCGFGFYNPAVKWGCAMGLTWYKYKYAYWTSSVENQVPKRLKQGDRTWMSPLGLVPIDMGRHRALHSHTTRRERTRLSMYPLAVNCDSVTPSFLIRKFGYREEQAGTRQHWFLVFLSRPGHFRVPCMLLCTS